MLPQMIVNGWMLGMTLMMVALGLTLVFGIMRIVNLAHGEFYMLGGMLVWFLFNRLGMGFWPSVVIVTVVVAVMGIVVEKYFLRQFRNNLLPSVIVSVGLMMVIHGSVMLTFGLESKSLPSIFHGMLRFLGASISTERLAITLIATALSGAAILFIGRTKRGKAMRAVSQDPTAAALQGVSINAVSRLTMIVGSALAALAGAMVAPIFIVDAFVGLPILLKALIAITIGGMGSVGGVVLGALLLGFVESFAVTLASTEVAYMLLFAILILTLLFRPTGFFGYEYRIE